ncbi:MAG TPA: acetyl-CoA carboxylase biotin carboxyl carrier protein subunit [Stellaceae bacterium]|nr:acetyl-CoA carboxylase biotin carboxyl carrier protein subunit [Stellaceae bacterium]
MKFGGSRPKLAPDPGLIRSLAKLLDETGLSEIEYEADGQRIHVARQAAVLATSAASVAPSALEKPTVAAPAGANGAAHHGANGHDHPGTLKAPLVGVAYLAAEPGMPPYVRVGDTVAEGQTLLIIEAMKVMNQIRAPQAGRVTHVYVGDAEPVEYGSALMLIE